MIFRATLYCASKPKAKGLSDVSSEVDEPFQFRALVEPWTVARAAALHSPENDAALEIACRMQIFELDAAKHARHPGT